jgi:uncharacterized membrane protein YdbT with pleckstrin-like domain
VETGPGEHVIFEGHPSWRSILGFYIKGLLITAVAGGIAALVTRISDDRVKVGVVVLVVAVVFALVLLAGLVKRISTTYTITNQRLHIRRGIISRKVQQTRLERVQNVNYDQSVLDRLLRVGNVDFDTAGSDDSDFRFDWVNRPDAVVQAVDKAHAEAEGTRPQPGI